MGNIVFNRFQNPKLNEIAAAIISRTDKIISDYREAEKRLTYAIQGRWMNGRDFVENEEAILAECKYQKNFAEAIGITEQMLSNDVRAYRALKAEGVTDVEQLIPKLKEKNVAPTTYSWERLPSLLNNPLATTRDQRPRDERRLEAIAAELREIQARNETENKNLIAPVKQLRDQVEDLREYIVRDDPFRSEWKSEKYLQFVRSIGRCSLTDKPCKVEPHHTNLDGGSGGVGRKLPDYMTIPVSPELHDKIESGIYVPSKEEIAYALIKTMALFIRTHG